MRLQSLRRAAQSITGYMHESWHLRYVGIELDSKYTGITSELVLFPYIFAYEDSPEYEMLERDKDRLKSKIIKL